ncbi:MAG TPA: LicD family protein [Candidatus Phocaeicola gallinarum]|nr:LicD family protein [Candidatus Phocaeicola gallinarum]
MKPIYLEEQKQIQLNILAKVDQFCEENNLRYSLGGGTLLGAVRHKGFIPWDDDIDIMMPRPDYDKFVHNFNGYDKDLTCAAHEIDKNFIQIFAKVYNNKTLLKEQSLQDPLGIFIDVFPIDGFPSDERTVTKYVRKITFLRKLLQIKNLDNKLRWKRIIAKSILYFFPVNYLQKRMQKAIKEYPFEESLYAGATCGRYKEKERYQRDVFEKYTTLDFENRKFKVIKEYDLYLKQHYGDYMKLPPVEEQVGNHTEYAYWK